jgi:GntR family transcriptional regulator
MGVSKQQRTPLYLQLYETLRAQVQSGKLPPGGRVPAESALMESYRVSRITVRSALDQMVQAGLIVRQRGRGTFVRRRPPEEHRCLDSFTDRMLDAGRTPGARLLRLESARATDLGTALPFEPDEPITLIERLRTVDGAAAALIRSYLPARFVNGLGRDDFASTGRAQSLLRTLEYRFGVVLHRGEETVSATGLTSHEAAHLGLYRGHAVVERACLMRSLTGEPLLFERAVWCTPQTHAVERRPSFPIEG